SPDGAHGLQKSPSRVRFRANRTSSRHRRMTESDPNRKSSGRFCCDAQSSHSGMWWGVILGFEGTMKRREFIAIVGSAAAYGRLRLQRERHRDEADEQPTRSVDGQALGTEPAAVVAAEGSECMSTPVPSWVDWLGEMLVKPSTPESSCPVCGLR